MEESLLKRDAEVSSLVAGTEEEKTVELAAVQNVLWREVHTA